MPGSEPSGAAIGAGPFNGIAAPFAHQPVQGFSGVVNRRDGTFDVLSDNGYGNKANSADFLLRVHRIKPDLRGGTAKVLGGFNLSDPDRHVPFPLTRADRVLTGADFDIESIQRMPDGTYWIGDEFGPWLLHFSAKGRLLQAPIALDGVRAPENPYLNGAQPNIASSKGFEGLVRSVDGRHLYPLLEGTVTGDTPVTCGSASSICAGASTPASATSTVWSRPRTPSATPSPSTGTGSWSSSATAGRATRPSSSASTWPTPATATATA